LADRLAVWHLFSVDPSVRGDLMLWLYALASCSEYDLNNKPKPPPEEEEPEPEDNEPVADAGPDQERQPLQDVELDGTDSHDPEGLDITAVKWTLLEKPSGSTSELERDDVARPMFWADLAGEYVFELTVQNEEGVWDSSPDEVVITVLPLDGFYVELSWDNDNDLDLHLMDASADLFASGDCNYCNPNPQWGEPGGADNPSLDIDDIDGFGPETITIDAPTEGTFYVAVHYYGEQGFPFCDGQCAVSEATINIYVGGELAESFTTTLDGQGDLWRVAQLDWPSAAISELGQIDHTNKTGCQ
jgi:hypothetical protein